MTQLERYAFIGALATGVWYFAQAMWSLFILFMFFAWLLGYWEVHWL